MISHKLLFWIRNFTCTCSKHPSGFLKSNFLVGKKLVQRNDIRSINYCNTQIEQVESANNGCNCSNRSKGAELRVVNPCDNTYVHVAKLLKTDILKAKRIVSNFPQFCEIPQEEIVRRYNFLESKNVTIRRIRKMPWLLLLNSSDLEERAKEVGSTLKLDFICAISFLKMPRSTWLSQIAILWDAEQAVEEEFKLNNKYKNRLEYVADKLKCENWEVADMMIKSLSLQEQPFHRLKYVLNLLLEAPLNPQEIISEPMLFQHNIPLIKRRLNLVHKYQLLNINAWMIRTADISFNEYIEDMKKRQKLQLVTTSDDELMHFCQSCLECSNEEMERILSNEDCLKTTELSKIHKRFDNLIEKGFTIQDIKRVPAILCQSEGLINSRCEQLSTLLNEVGSASESVLIRNFTYSFTKPSKEWSDFLQRYSSKVKDKHRCDSHENDIQTIL